jgi:hypothetical protein
VPPTRTPPPAPPVPPAEALARLLPPEVDLATGAGLRHEAAVPVWFGMVWGRLGRGDLAWAQWDRVRLAVLQPWIAAERGRLLRELGDHRAAAALEWPALAAAEDPVDQVMLRLSLAADAVGLGDLAAARRRLAGASEQLETLSDGPRRERQRLRAAWVAVEVALLAGDPAPTALLPRWGSVAPPDLAALPGLDALPDLAAQPAPGGALVLPAPYASGTVFHRAKGCLFAGVLARDRTLLHLAARDAPPALRWAVYLALASLGGSDAEVAHARARAETDRARVVPPPVPGGSSTPSGAPPGGLPEDPPDSPPDSPPESPELSPPDGLPDSPPNGRGDLPEAPPSRG